MKRRATLPSDDEVMSLSDSEEGVTEHFHARYHNISSFSSSFFCNFISYFLAINVMYL